MQNRRMLRGTSQASRAHFGRTCADLKFLEVRAAEIRELRLTAGLQNLPNQLTSSNLNIHPERRSVGPVDHQQVHSEGRQQMPDTRKRSKLQESKPQTSDSYFLRSLHHGVSTSAPWRRGRRKPGPSRLEGPAWVHGCMCVGPRIQKCTFPCHSGSLYG